MYGSGNMTSVNYLLAILSNTTTACGAMVSTLQGESLRMNRFFVLSILEDGSLGVFILMGRGEGGGYADP